MRREGQYMICTIPELARWLWNSIDCYGIWEETPDSIAEIDFCLAPMTTKDISLAEIERECSGWYGLKSVDTGMNSGWLNVVTDLYGGGAAEMITIAYKDEGSLKDIENMLYHVLENNEGSECRNEILFVENRSIELQ